MHRSLPLVLLLLAAPASAADHVVIQRDDADMRLSGKVIAETTEGRLLLLQTDGVLWEIEPDEIVARSSDSREFKPLTPGQLGQQLLDELPPGFKVHRTANYVICYDTSTAYARWCGALYERLHLAFYNFWRHRGWELDPPELPLAAIVFQSKADYIRYARRELGDAAESVVGYYSLRTNRVVMHDLTGADERIAERPSGSSTARINAMLSRPAAGGNVATVIHEAVHQLAFNSGMQTRHAEIPLWVSEGLAMYFETPDLDASRGWRTIGAVNRPRLIEFRRGLAEREVGSLASMIVSDTRLRRTDTAVGGYAEAWALNYYLLRKHSEAYVDYLRSLSAKKPLIDDTPDERLNAFRRALNVDLNALEADFVRYMREVD